MCAFKMEEIQKRVFCCNNQYIKDSSTSITYINYVWLLLYQFSKHSAEFVSRPMYKKAERTELLVSLSKESEATTATA